MPLHRPTEPAISAPGLGSSLPHRTSARWQQRRVPGSMCHSCESLQVVAHAALYPRRNGYDDLTQGCSPPVESQRTHSPLRMAVRKYSLERATWIETRCRPVGRPHSYDTEEPDGPDRWSWQPSAIATWCGLICQNLARPPLAATPVAVQNRRDEMARTSSAREVTFVEFAQWNLERVCERSSYG